MHCGAPTSIPAIVPELLPGNAVNTTLLVVRSIHYHIAPITLRSLVRNLVIITVRINMRLRELPRIDFLGEQQIQFLIRPALGFRQAEVRPDRHAGGGSGPEEARFALPVLFPKVSVDDQVFCRCMKERSETREELSISKVTQRLRDTYPFDRIQHVRVQHAGQDLRHGVRVPCDDDGLWTEADGGGLRDDGVANRADGQGVDELPDQDQGDLGPHGAIGVRDGGADAHDEQGAGNEYETGKIKGAASKVGE